MSRKFELKNSKGNYVVLNNKGAAIESIKIKNLEGKTFELCYKKEAPFNGATIGRVANRIINSEFELNGVTYKLNANEGSNHLHGGVKGYDKYEWSYKEEENKVTFYRVSKDGEEFYPGNLSIITIYEFNDENELIITYKAKSDKDTIISLTNHVYFKTDKDDLFQINSDSYTNLQGEILSVSETPYDLRQPKKVDAIYDHNFALNRHELNEMVANVYLSKSKINLKVYTTQPGLQFYNCLKGSFCLETQGYPNAINLKEFPSIVLLKGEEYYHVTKYVFE